MTDQILAAHVYPPKCDIVQCVVLSRKGDRYEVSSKRQHTYKLFEPIYTYESFHSLPFALKRFKALKAQYRKEFAQ